VSDDSEGRLINFPVGSDVTGRPPQLPDPGRLFPDDSEGSEIPSESPEEITMELPPIPAAPRPESALVSREVPLADPGGISVEEVEEGEYEQPRSLADRLADWLEYRIEVGRARLEGEAPYREAEIARKVALLEARTAQEIGLMEAQAKLRQAHIKANADRTNARGKADADRSRSSGSGMGADKGGRSKTGGGGGSRGGGGNSGGSGRGGTGGGRGSGTNSSGSAGRGSGGGNSPKGAGKGSDRSAGGRGGGSKRNEPSGGSKGRQNGSGDSGSGKGSTGKGSSGSSGSGKGGSKGDGGKPKDSPASSPRAERARGRQERAAARQAARQQRRSADQAASLTDRSKDRDQDRANRQAAREERRAAKAERKAAREAKREAAKAADDRTTLGAAVAEEAQHRWDKRRTDAKDTKGGQSGAEKENRTENKDTKGKGTDSKGEKDAGEAPDGASTAGKDDSAPHQPGKTKKADDGPSGGSKHRHRFWRGRTAGTGRAKGRDRARGTRRTEPGGQQPRSPFGPEDSTPTVEWPQHPTDPPRPAGDGRDGGDDIVDADIVPDGPAAVTTGVKSLPPASEPHTQRPGTTRPTAQEDPVASEARKAAPGQAGMAAQHRTDITFEEYLMEIVNIAIAAALDKDRAQDLAIALGKIADALRDMAADLVGDHNIATKVVDQIEDLADAATRMKQLAERCATECEIASQGARITAAYVGRVYGEDVQAMDDAGLAHASAAAHHD
jgi:hypothetical protein